MKTTGLLFALVLMISSASASVFVYNTGDGSSAWGGDPQVAISNISAPPWAPNGTTGAGAIWVNQVDSGFQGGGPALGMLTVYTLSINDVMNYRVRALADDGAKIELSLNGGAFATLVNSSGAPQGVNCSSLSPSCPASMVWDSGLVALSGDDVVFRFTTSQDVARTPMGFQATISGEQVPEPGALTLAAIGLTLIAIRSKS
jgi:hypothetical protein